MDSAKVVAKAVMVAGLVFVWPGPRIVSLFFPGWSTVGQPVVTLPVPPMAPPAPAPRSASGWFDAAKSSCNGVEVASWMRMHPAPEGFDGTSYAATCLALAGHIDEARNRILELPPGERYKAAGVVFEAGHPAADAGDDIAAGPLMELVVEFWPNHYMALYHAGASRFQKDDMAEARSYLERFLQFYDEDDSWTKSARRMLQTAGPSPS